MEVTPLGPSQRKPGGATKMLLIILVVILVAGGGVAVYLLTRPQPVISLTSEYHFGSTAAGSTGTVFHLSGQRFSSNSAISFLLDGTPAPGGLSVHSDAGGNFKMNLIVTDGWTVGTHTLTAKDASKHVTKMGIRVQIVPQGQAHTPGPHGAPADDMLFSLNISIQAQDGRTGQQLTPSQQILTIKGQRDPVGGTVCQSLDNGQTQTFNGTLNGGRVTYRETYTQTCSGTYKGGKLAYIQTVTSDQYTLADGASCMPKTPYMYEQLIGTFTALNTVSGVYSLDAITASCSNGNSLTFGAAKGIWTGQE